MSRRASSAQALEQWTIIKDALANPDFCPHEHDSESVTRDKLDKLHKIRGAISVVGSFIANPDWLPVIKVECPHSSEFTRKELLGKLLKNRIRAIKNKENQ